MGKRAEAVAVEAPAASACVAYTGGWSGDLMVVGVSTLDQHQIDAEFAARLVESGAYSALPDDCVHEAQATSEVTE